MTVSVKLISVRQILEASVQDDFVWTYQTNDQWMPFPDDVSSSMEKAFRCGMEEIFIDGNYRIDLKYFVQEYVNDRNCKQFIRRRRRKKSLSINTENEDESRRRERFSFPLGLVSSCNTSVETNYYGSPFIAEWFLVFTKGERTVTFDSIFPVLVNGLRVEGQTEPERVVRDIVEIFNKISDKIVRKSNKKRMEDLENVCAILYTRPYFIYRMVNTALRDNDRTKLLTLGPYCFLVFNYIGRHCEDDFSILRGLRQKFRAPKPQSTTVFRGDYISYEIIEEYRQAAGDEFKYCKWLSFVSTSRDQDVAEDFAKNVLYIIALKHRSSKDQFVDISTLSTFKEEEILLQPGVRFQVVKVEFDQLKSLHFVYITIIPSYVSNLR